MRESLEDMNSFSSGCSLPYVEGVGVAIVSGVQASTCGFLSVFRLWI